MRGGPNHDSPSPEQSPSPTTSQSSSPTSSRAASRFKADCASPDKLQQILRSAVNAPLPLTVDGRALPGHSQDQVNTLAPDSAASATSALSAS